MDKREAEDVRKTVAGRKVDKVKAMYYVPADLHEALKRHCAQEGVSASDTVEELLRRYLRALGKEPK